MVELHLYGSTNSFKLEPAQKISGWTTSVRLSYFSLFIKSGPRFPGWCATNVDKNGKIREVGLCADSCMSEATNIDFTSINLLTQDECKYIFELSKYLVSLNKSETGVFQRREGGGAVRRNHNREIADVKMSCLFSVSLILYRPASGFMFRILILISYLESWSWFHVQNPDPGFIFRTLILVSCLEPWSLFHI